MFTSRAEYRLLLRQDNADLRLSEMSYNLGLLSVERFRKLESKRKAIELEIDRLRNTRDGTVALSQILKRPEVSYRDLPGVNPELSHEEIQQVEISIKYEGYIARQQVEVNKLRSVEEKQIPDWLDYSKIPSMRNEARQKLQEIQPRTVGQASRISGISPADVSLLLVYMKRGPRENAPKSQVSEDTELS